MQIETLYQHFVRYPSVTTDSRKIGQGDIFFALKGPNFNGNAYAKQALELGASLAVVDEDTGMEDERIIRVPDTLGCLQALALHHRRQFNIPFIAITGSNGKTTTKELVHAVLSSTFRTYTTEGNLNNHIGVPLTILKIRRDAEIAIIEMGANHQQEIASYCRYTLPTHGLITNCGKAHLEGFGGIEGVRKGKGELFDFLRAGNGTVFINWDYDYLREMSKGLGQIIKYGTETTPGEIDVAGAIASQSEYLQVTVSRGADIPLIRTNLVGEYNLPNVLAAVCIGKHFGVSDEKIKTSIEAYHPTNSRSQLIVSGNNRIILDAYNANPNSMRAAIENFAKMEGDKKVLVLGAMMELGQDSVAEHRKLVELLQQYTWQQVVLVGKDYLPVPDPFLYFEKTAEAAAWYRTQQFQHCSILLKGSRSMQMEKLLE